MSWNARGGGRGRGRGARADDVAFGLVDDDDGSAVPGLVPAAATAAARAEAASSSARATATRHSNASSIVGGREGGWGGAGRYESDEGWAREHARRGRGRGSRPRSAFVVANERSPRVDPTDGLGGAGAPRERTPATDPYGRGNARLRSARRSNAPGGPTPVTSLGGTGPRAPANESPSRPARGTRIDPATTIRIDARGTADPADEETDGEVDEEMEEWRRFRQTRARPNRLRLRGGGRPSRRPSRRRRPAPSPRTKPPPRPSPRRPPRRLRRRGPTPRRTRGSRGESRSIRPSRLFGGSTFRRTFRRTGKRRRVRGLGVRTGTWRG